MSKRNGNASKAEVMADVEATRKLAHRFVATLIKRYLHADRTGNPNPIGVEDTFSQELLEIAKAHVLESEDGPQLDKRKFLR